MSEQPPEKTGNGGFNPLTILKDSIRVVPAMKYALAVLGLVAIVAIVTLWRVRYDVAVFGTVVILGLMVPVLVFAKLTKVAPKHFLGPARVFMWAFVMLTIVAGTCLFTAAAFRQPQALYELIFDKPALVVPKPDLTTDPKPDPKPESHPPEFTAQFVYRTNMIERTEFTTEPGHAPSENLEEFLVLSRLAYGTIEKTNRAFQVDVTIKNTGREAVFLDLNERFFSLTDNTGRSGELLYFCCASKGDVLPPGQERVVQLFFKDAGWHGKGVSARAIFFRVQGFLPVVRASWKAPTLATAA